MVNVPFRQIVGSNQQTYQRLSLSLHLNLRRQIFIAVCDDLILRDRLATQLQTELNSPPPPSPLPPSQSSVLSPSPSETLREQPSLLNYPHLVSLQLSLEDPNPLLQIAQWLAQSPPPIVEGYPTAIPAFQILGIEHLTRQSSAIQRLFFTHLQTIEQNLPLLDFSVLLWMTQPWFHALSDSAPEFWRCRTGVFEFIGDPTPLTITSPEQFGVQSSQQQPSQQLSQQSIAPSLPPSHRDRTAASSVAANSQDTQARKPAIEPGIRTDQPAEESWLALSIDELQEDTEPEGLSQAEISTLLGEVLPVSSLVSSSASSPVSSEQEIRPVEVAPLPPTETAEALENPWLVLGEALIQPYEPLEAVEVTQEVTQEATQEVTQALQEQTASRETDFQPPATLPKPEEADPGRSIPYVPIQLPEGLPQREQIQGVLQKIEQLHQHQAETAMLVDAYRSLGNLFRDRIEQGEVTPQNLIVAIQAYEQALLRLSDFSPLWVDILNDLGNLYWMASRTTPNTAEALSCLNQAVQAYQFALSKIDPQTQSYTYPMVHNNLGAAYADMARHDNATQNLELSVQSYREALHWRKPETDPLRYASTQNNLGTTYWNLAQYKEAAANLKLAIEAYADALQYYHPAEEPLNYAMIQNNLGTAYWNLAQHERSPDWLMSAVSAYRMALEYRTLDANPVAHAATQNNLGTAYWHMANETEQAQERVDFLQQAIEAYEAALQAVKHLQTHQPHAVAMLNFDIFATQNNLGLAYYQIATDALNSLDSQKQSHCLQSALDRHIMAWQGWAQKPNLRQTAFNCIVQTIQASYNQLGLPGQSLALSRVPGELLPEILPKL